MIMLLGYFAAVEFYLLSPKLWSLLLLLPEELLWILNSGLPIPALQNISNVSKLYVNTIVPLQSCLSVVHLIVYLIQFVYLTIHLSHHHICLLIHLMNILLDSYQDILTLLLSSITFINDSLSIVHLFKLHFVWRFRLMSEKILLSSHLISTRIHSFLQFFKSLLKFLQLRSMWSNITLIKTRLNGWLVCSNQSVNPLQMFLALQSSLFIGSSQKVSQIAKFIFELFDLSSNIIRNFLVTRHQVKISDYIILKTSQHLSIIK